MNCSALAWSRMESRAALICLFSLPPRLIQLKRGVLGRHKITALTSFIGSGNFDWIAITLDEILTWWIGKRISGVSLVGPRVMIESSPSEQAGHRGCLCLTMLS